MFVQHQFSFSLSLFSLMFLTCGRTDTAMEKAVPFFFFLDTFYCSHCFVHNLALTLMQVAAGIRVSEMSKSLFR